MTPTLTRRSVLCTVLSIGLAAALIGCGGGDDGGPDGDGQATAKPIIVATIYPLADVARQVVGEDAEVVCLVPPGATPHGFEPTAADAEALSRASMLIRVGMGFDDWAVTALRKHGKPGVVTVAMSGEGADAHGHDHGDHDHDHKDHDHAHDGEDGHHHHAGPNPHIWLDPVRMATFAHELGHEFMELIPAAADPIHERAHAVEADIEKVDAEYKAALAGLSSPKIITFHDAFNVMAQRYGVEVAATLMPVDPTGSLTADRIEKVLAVVREHGLKVVYTEPQFPAEAGDVLRGEAGLRVLTLDPLGDPSVPERDTYQKMMRFNLKALLAGFEAAGK